MKILAFFVVITFASGVTLANDSAVDHSDLGSAYHAEGRIHLKSSVNTEGKAVNGKTYSPLQHGKSIDLIVAQGTTKAAEQSLADLHSRQQDERRELLSSLFWLTCYTTTGERGHFMWFLFNKELSHWQKGGYGSQFNELDPSRWKSFPKVVTDDKIIIRDPDGNYELQISKNLRDAVYYFQAHTGSHSLGNRRPAAVLKYECERKAPSFAKK